MDKLLNAAIELESFVGVMFGRGPDAVIPETVNTPLGIPVKLREIMVSARAAIVEAETRTPYFTPKDTVY